MALEVKEASTPVGGMRQRHKTTDNDGEALASKAPAADRQLEPRVTSRQSLLLAAGGAMLFLLGAICGTMLGARPVV